jgi:hypothetical protein
MKPISLVLLIVFCLSAALTLSAQETTVPDLKGLNGPQAAAALNRVGLRLGVQSSIGWTEASGVAQNTIGGQSLEAGTSTAAGQAVDVTIMRSPNLGLIYDDNDLTAVNLTGSPLDVRNIVFTSKEGTPATFEAVSWRGVFDIGGCGQIWSVQRGAPKDTPGCDTSIMNWLSTTKTNVHFWTATNGVVRFSIMDNGVERAVCDAADVGTQDAPLHCDAFISGGGDGSDVTPYIYLVYTTDAFAFLNKSPDKWMPTAQTTIINNNPKIAIPGAGVSIGDPVLFNTPDIVADIRQLAPGQCLFLTSDNANATPPEPCDPIARLDLTSDVAFWVAAFQIQSTNDTAKHECPAAVVEKMTICVVPR